MDRTEHIDISIIIYPDYIDLDIETAGKLSNILPAMVVMNKKFIAALPKDAQEIYIKLLKSVLNCEFRKESRGA